MREDEQQSWLDFAVMHWEEQGTLPPFGDKAPYSSNDASARRAYRTLLQLERLVVHSEESEPSEGEAEHSLEEKLEAPSSEELKRGAHFVLKQIRLAQQQEEAATIHTTQTLEHQDTQSAHSDTSLSEPQPEHNEDHSATGLASPQVTGSPWWSLAVGVCALLLFIQVTLPPTENTHPLTQLQSTKKNKRPALYIGQKGSGTASQERQLRLMFGWSDADQSQPQNRGTHGMYVPPGKWLYFLFMKPQKSGFIYVFKRNGGHRPKLLYPPAGQHVHVKKELRQWVLAHQGVALRYKVPKLHKKLGFIGVFSAHKLSAVHLERIQKMHLKSTERTQLIQQVAQHLNVPAHSVDAFLLRRTSK